MEAAKGVFEQFYHEKGRELDDAAIFIRGFLSILPWEREGIAVERIISRVKSLKSCLEKIERKYSHVGKDAPKAITDLIGARVVCYYADDIERIEALISANSSVLARTDKIASLEEAENIFGYRALHLDIRLDDQRARMPEYERYRDWQFEVQIRTVVQDAWSTLDHKIKYKHDIPRDLRRRVVTLAALAELMDREFIHIRQLAVSGASAGAEVVGMAAADNEMSVFEFIEFVRTNFPNLRAPGESIAGIFDQARRSATRISERVNGTSEEERTRVRTAKALARILLDTR